MRNAGSLEPEFGEDEGWRVDAEETCLAFLAVRIGLVV